MKLEDLPIYAYFQLEDYAWDDVKDLPGADEDFQADWDGMARTVVEDRFRNAAGNLWPLLSRKKFKSISIGIDLIGMESGMAGYYHDWSDNDKGKYGFSVSVDVLSQYLASDIDPEKPVSPHTLYMWEHELIHLLDHDSITEFKFNLRSTDVREFLIHFLLTYRNEGIADLWFALKGHGSLGSMEQSKSKFLEDFKRFFAAEWENESKIKQLEWEVMQTYGFYSAGPWAVLHVLSCEEYKGWMPSAETFIKRLESGAAIPEEEILEIISHAMKITNYDFIECLKKPGDDGKPFIDGSLLNNLASRLRDIEHKRVISEEDEEYNRVNRGLIAFYDKCWPS